MDKTHLANRIEQLQDHLHQQRAAGAIIWAGSNLKYLANFDSPYALERLTCLVVPANDAPTLIVPELDAEAAVNAGVERLRVWPDATDPYQVVADTVGPWRGGRWGVEKNRLTMATWERLAQALGAPEIFDVGEFLGQQRKVKNPEEIKALEKAAHALNFPLAHLCESLRPGMGERQILNKVISLLEEARAERPSFDPIVLGGTRTSMPHGVSGPYQLRHGDPLLLDFGAVVDGYCSDITRTFFVGEPSEELRKVYQTVLEANLAGISAIKEGVKASEVDTAAREVIRRAGYGEFFTHRTGHGVGIEVHEGPYIAADQDEILVAGMVITVEPGVYLPGVGGVRIEDMVLVTEDGAEVLTTWSKDLVSAIVGGSN